MGNQVAGSSANRQPCPVTIPGPCMAVCTLVWSNSIACLLPTRQGGWVRSPVCNDIHDIHCSVVSWHNEILMRQQWEGRSHCVPGIAEAADGIQG